MVNSWVKLIPFLDPPAAGVSAESVDDLARSICCNSGALLGFRTLLEATDLDGLDKLWFSKLGECFADIHNCTNFRVAYVTEFD